MTNWKEEDHKKHKAKKKDKEKEKNNGKTKSETEWKKAANASKVVSKIKASYRRKTAAGNQGHTDSGPGQSGSSVSQEPAITETGDEQRQCEAENPEVLTEEQNKPDEGPTDEQATEEKKPEVHKNDGKSKKHGGKSKRAKPTAVPEKLEPKPVEEEDPLTVLKNKVFQVIKNAFSLAYTEEEELRINVDNIFPLLKALGLNPQSESVVDLVRDACMESSGDIDAKDFESVVLALIKEQDDDLWMGRLEEKQFAFWEAEAKTAKLEAERLRLEQEREKAGFEKEDGYVDEWADYERQKKEEEDKKDREKLEDELYNNLKMAFRFIDADGDGVISTKDLYALMMGVGEMMTDDELFGMVNTADLDCDGKVTFQDFKNFLNPGQEDENPEDAKPPETVRAANTDNDAEKQEAEGDGKADAVKDQKQTDDASKQAEDSAKPNDQSGKPGQPEMSEEEKEKALRRRKSMLWGYMSAATKLAKPIVESPSTVEETAEDEETKAETDKAEVEGETVQIKVTEESEVTSDESKSEVQSEEADKTETGNLLDSIREEDEHSNYDLDGHAPAGTKTDNKAANLVENKRKLFSRQSSSASLKNRPNSVITGTGSIGDSGIETLDTNYGSEIRDQPDVFDLSDGEGESTNRKSAKRARQRLKSHQDVYNADEEDEDMIEPRHVHESLSRVSSMESLEDDLKDVEEETVTGKESAEDSEERTRNFVEQHMYVEVEPIPEETELERLRRAEFLQKAILRRSVTQPNIIRYRSNINRPKTAKPSVNGYSCSHIDIDLTCDAPPKADIKSKRIVQRCRTPRDKGTVYDKAMADRPVSIVDICGVLNADENLPDQYDLPKWPARPLTRPRSPTQKRIASAKERQTHHAHMADDSVTPRPPHQVRSQSAVPFLRENTSRPLTPRRIIKRPQTAQIPYTKSKRMENAFSKFEKNDNLTVVMSEPFLNSDALYPNKTKFTTNHHGFKSIWPIGRKINAIQDKRPFSAFEMNSYSRAIERNELPFKKTCPTEAIDPFPVSEPQVIPEPEVKMLPTRRTLIKLELNTDGLKRPVGRKISTIIRTGFSPRSVTPRTVR